MDDVELETLTSRLSTAMAAILPSEARFALVWVVTQEDGTFNIETSHLNVFSNVSNEMVVKFGEMLATPTQAPRVPDVHGSS